MNVTSSILTFFNLNHEFIYFLKKITHHFMFVYKFIIIFKSKFLLIFKKFWNPNFSFFYLHLFDVLYYFYNHLILSFSLCPSWLFTIWACLQGNSSIFLKSKIKDDFVFYFKFHLIHYKNIKTNIIIN